MGGSTDVEGLGLGWRLLLSLCVALCWFYLVAQVPRLTVTRDGGITRVAETSQEKPGHEGKMAKQHERHRETAEPGAGGTLEGQPPRLSPLLPEAVGEGQAEGSCVSSAFAGLLAREGHNPGLGGWGTDTHG